ncbi:hypothetical protein ACQPZQ_28160 [Pseudonocardia sp. CA-142604]|uniref:hypothetical protein n=1 Tax=Pseudonocardia sp. CA-142604 TaxID=3240024 RepID=UPI003D8F2DC5
MLFLSFPEDAQLAAAGAAAAALPQLRHIAVLVRGHDGRIRAVDGHPAVGRAPVLDKVIAAVQDGRLPGYAALVHPGRPVILVAARDQFAEVFAAAAADAGVVLNRLRVPWTGNGPASARQIRISSSRRPFTMCTHR